MAGGKNRLISEIGLALRNLSRNANRTLVAVATIASGVIAYLLAGGFIEWVLDADREGAIHSQLGHAQIVRPGFFDKGIADPYAFLLPADSREFENLAKTSGVNTITQRLVFSGLISRGDTTLAFSGEGIDPVRERPLATAIDVFKGKDLSAIDERKVLLGEGLANSLGAAPGDSVVLLTSTATGSPSAIEVVVAGIFVTPSKEYDDYAIRLPLEAARKLMRVTGATSWVVLLDETPRTQDFVAAARTRLPSDNFEIVPWRDLADFHNKTEALFTKQVWVVKIIIGLIIVLTIANTLTMSVMERTFEIGSSFAMGVRRWVVMRMFVLEALLLGMIGGALGVVIGYLLALGISAIGIPMPPPPGMTQGFDAEIIVTPGLMWDAVFLSLLTTLIAGVMPAWKAGHMNIVDALRYNQ
jgi:putative ABC transport system permease protein